MCVAVFLCAAIPATAQKPKVEIFTVENGLPSSTITDLAQDTSGRLWILNRSGVTVYDGRFFRTFSGTDGLPKGELRALEIDADGQVWVVAHSRPRLYLLEDETWQALPPAAPLGNRENVVTAMTVLGSGDSKLVVLGTTSNGLWYWNGDVWGQLGEQHGLASERVLSLGTFGGRVMVGTSHGLCQLSLTLQIDCALRKLGERLNEDIYAIYSAPLAGGEQQLWLLGQTWLGTLEREALDREAPEGAALNLLADGFTLSSLGPMQPGAIALDRAGGIYFGSPAVGFYLDPQRLNMRLLGTREGLVSEGATALLVDREANVWIGSVRGLNKISSRRFLSFDRNQGLLEREVTAIVEPRPGELVLGHNTGLTFFDGERTEIAPFERPNSPLSSQRVLDLAVDSEGVVWVAAQSMGLLRVTAGRSWVAELKSELIRSVEASTTGELWALASEKLYRRVGSKFSEIDLGAAGKAVESLRRVVYGDDGRLYLGARGGLLFLDKTGHDGTGDDQAETDPTWPDPTGWQLARGPTEEASNVFDIFAEAGGPVWVGTSAGLFQLAGHNLVPVRLGGITIEPPVFLIFPDNDGRIWFGTDDGVVIWDGHDVRHFSVQHGLSGRETNRGAGLVDHSGQVWIGTDQGMSLYQHLYAANEVVAPWAELRGVEIDGLMRPLEQELRLGHRQTTLTFHFEPISMSTEESMVYRHMLEGFDNDWQGPSLVSSSEVRYTNVPPGRYRFSLEVGWPDGPWSPALSSASIVIARPYWRQLWFYLLAIAMVAFAGFGVHSLRTHAIRARNAELEALTDRLNDNIGEREQLIDDLEAKNQELERFTYTVSHDLKSPLVTITGFLGYLEKDAEAGNMERVRTDVARIAGAAGKMGELLDELLELSRIGRVVHPPEQVTAGDLAQEAMKMAAGQIAAGDVAVTIAPDLPILYGDRVRLLEVMQNLIENAVKFMGDEVSPRIEVGVRPGAPPVITVRDNGVGIEPEYHDRIFSLFERLDHHVAGTGVGLTLVKRIVEIHGGRVWVESAGLGQGSTFCFTLAACDEGVPKVKT